MQWDSTDHDFRDMLGLLRQYGVEFMVVGAHALAVYLPPRSTGDLDIWVRATPEQAALLWKALLDFGAPLAGVKPQDFASVGYGLHIGVPPGRIDILTELSGISFGEAWNHRVKGMIFGIEVDVPSLQAILLNKLASGRPKDLLDVASIQKHLHKSES